MHCAALYDHTDTYRGVLKELGEDVNARDINPMHCAANNGHTSTCTVLKELGADLNANQGHKSTDTHASFCWENGRTLALAEC